MKRFFVFLSALILAALFCLPSFAGDLPRFNDDAGLLDSARAETLCKKLDRLSEELDFDIVIATFDYIDTYDVERFTCDYYDDNHFGLGAGYDGVILLINMDERDWVITSTDFGEKAINTDARAYLSDYILDDLHEGRYYEAFDSFADISARLVRDAKAGKTFKIPFGYAKALLISLAVGAIIAFIYVSVLKSKLKTVHRQYAAGNYLVDGSMNITLANERFLYNVITRTAKPKSNSSSSTGSGGQSHSSSSGKF